jgi:hypothetical protein
MGKNNKKRVRKLTVYGCLEGDREHIFLDFLRSIYRPDMHNIAFYSKHASGGTPDCIVKAAIIECHRDKSFAWFDEDFEPAYPLSKEIKEKLAVCWKVPEEQNIAFAACSLRDVQCLYNSKKRKPILIVSQPVCVEALILRTLGYTLPYDKYDYSCREEQINKLKNTLKGLFKKAPEASYYAKNLSREKLEDVRKIIPELDLLISMLTNED